MDYATEATPMPLQCFKLLKAQSAYMTYWFAQLFPDFEGPNPGSLEDFDDIKSVLYLWILHFGPFEIDTWTDIKAAMNGPGENWKNYIAWIDSIPGFSVDAGATVKAFPNALISWLQSSYASTVDCPEVNNTFNVESTVCDNGSCSTAVKVYCKQVVPWSSCASS
jgi:hypothetical protein